MVTTSQDTFSRRVNLESFNAAVLALFRCLTGDGWTDLLMDAKRGLCRRPDEDHSGACGGSFIATLYFMSFVMIGTFGMLNLFVAVLLDQLEVASAGNINPLAPHRFQKAWSKFSLEGYPLLPVEKIEEFLLALNKPLGLSCISPTSLRHRRLLQIRAPVRHGVVTYSDMYVQLSMLTTGQPCHACV